MRREVKIFPRNILCASCYLQVEFLLTLYSFSKPSYTRCNIIHIIVSRNRAELNVCSQPLRRRFNSITHRHRRAWPVVAEYSPSQWYLKQINFHFHLTFIYSPVITLYLRYKYIFYSLQKKEPLTKTSFLLYGEIKRYITVNIVK